MVTLYLLAHWTAVSLIDFILVRHGHCTITDIFGPGGVCGRWGARGMPL